MATVQVKGAGHPGDPFQVRVELADGDLDEARSDRGVILDVPQTGYDADPQIRSVVIHLGAAAGG